MIRVFCAVCGEMGTHAPTERICLGCGAIGGGHACAAGSMALSTATRQEQGCFVQAMTQIVPLVYAPIQCPKCKKAMLKGEPR